MPFLYTAYGLGISSFVPLPELSAGAPITDVTIRKGDVDTNDVAEPTESGGRVHAAPGEARYVWDGVAAFAVNDGREIIVDPSPDADEAVIRLFLLGPVLALLLSQRGRLVLHGSTISVHGPGIALLGESNAGKSSLAAAMYSHGSSILSDDLTSVDMGSASPMLDAGYPQLGVWPDLVSALGLDPASMPRLRPDADKRALDVRDRFATAPVPLGSIYVIERGEEMGIEPLSPGQALPELLRHSYAAPMISAMGIQEEHLRRCARIAATVPVRRLRIERDLRSLPHLVAMLEGDLDPPPRP